MSVEHHLIVLLVFLITHFIISIQQIFSCSVGMMQGWATVSVCVY